MFDSLNVVSVPKMYTVTLQGFTRILHLFISVTQSLKTVGLFEKPTNEHF
jgi:hypothetical protein